MHPFEIQVRALSLQQVICESCTLSRDLDLCRDEDLLPSITSSGGGEAQHGQQTEWKCHSCGTAYGRLGIEEKLIAQVQQHVVQWQIQDLQCGKCRTLRVNPYMEHCSCSGSWICTIDRMVVLERLKVLENVASVYGLRMLIEVVKDALDGI